MGKQKKKTRLLFTIVMSMILLFSLSGTASAKSKVKLSATKKTLEVGKSFTLKLQNNNSKDKVKWSVSNDKVKITKSSKKQAKIKAVKRGTSTVKAKVGKKTYKCKITVNDKKTTVNEKKKLSISKEIVFEENGISIQTDSIKEDDKAYTLNFIVTNKGEKNCSVVAHSYCANGLFCKDNKYGFESQDVPIGKKAKYSITVGKDWMKENKITDIASFQIIFWAYIDNYASIQSDVVEIKTNLFGKVAEYKPNGMQVYSDDDIILWYVGNDKNDYTFIMKNNSSETQYTIDNFAVNEWSCPLTDYTYDLYDEEMVPNTYVKFTIPIKQEFLTSNNIKKVKTLEFNVGYTFSKQSENVTVTVN